VKRRYIILLCGKKREIPDEYTELKSCSISSSDNLSIEDFEATFLEEEAFVLEYALAVGSVL
jgi:hypothetical protein